MDPGKKYSPITFDATPEKTETRGHWEVVLAYTGEGDGPYLADLSHRARWDVQDNDVASLSPFGVAVPDAPGACRFENGTLVNRMNRTQAAVWHISGETPEFPEGISYTNTTDATVFLALFGKNVLSVTEKLTNLDMGDPAKKEPFLIQGPFSHVPCQIVVCGKDSENAGILFTCSRGYGKSMTETVLHAGHEFGITPAGEDRFQQWAAAVTG